MPTGDRKRTSASSGGVPEGPANPTFDHYMFLKFFLEDQLGRPVDLVVADCLKPRLKPIITREVAYA